MLCSWASIDALSAAINEDAVDRGSEAVFTGGEEDGPVDACTTALSTGADVSREVLIVLPVEGLLSTGLSYGMGEELDGYAEGCWIYCVGEELDG